jgi:hypothetical protein
MDNLENNGVVVDYSNDDINHPLINNLTEGGGIKITITGDSTYNTGTIPAQSANTVVTAVILYSGDEFFPENVDGAAKINAPADGETVFIRMNPEADNDDLIWYAERDTSYDLYIVYDFNGNFDFSSPDKFADGYNPKIYTNINNSIEINLSEAEFTAEEP